MPEVELEYSRLTIGRRLSIYYAILFASIGSIGPYFALWLDSHNVEASRIGIISAAPSFIMVLTTVLLGSWADRLKDWRTAIIACNWSVLILVLWFLLRQNLLDIFVVWTLSGLIIMAKVPIMDGASLSLARQRKLNFGRIRALGSAGFVVAILAAGRLYESIGIKAFVPVLIVGAMARVVAAHALPAFRADPDAERVDVSLVGSLRHPGFLLTITGAAIINGSHGFFYTFGILHWSEAGIDTSTSSFLWGMGVVVEVLVMWRFSSMARHMSARLCLMLAGVAGIIRWTSYALEPSVILLLPLQCLHGITFGLLYLATVSFISRRVEDRDAAKAQALSATLTTLVLAIATMSSGLLYESASEHGYWAMVVLCIVGMLLVAASYRTNLEDLKTPIEIN